MKPNSSRVAAYLSEVVALVQAQTLGMRWGGAGRGTGRRSTVACTSFMSWRLAPATASPRGYLGRRSTDCV